MNIESRELLKKVNSKKAECIRLVSENKMEEAKNEKKKLVQLQEQFEEMLDLEAEEQEEVKRNNSINKVLDERLIKNAIYPSDRMKFGNKSLTDNEFNNVDLGKLLKGMAGKGWDNALTEHNFFKNSMSSTGTKVIIPTPLSETILDLARSQSAIFGNIPIVPMENNSLKLAIQKKDADAYFVAEEEAITESEAVFDVAKLYGKTIAILIPLTEQLLDSTSNLTSQLENSCARAIATAIDKALLYGKGTGEEDSKEIKGLSTYLDVNQINHTGKVDYDFILKGIGAVKNNNIEPTNIAYNTTVGTDLSLAKDTLGQYIAPPSILGNYITNQSNNLNDKEALIFNKDSLVIGINKDVTIEYGHYNDTFKKIMKGLRVHMRVDLGVLRPKGVALSKVIEAVV